MRESFSDRYGYHGNDAEVTIREDAPEALRSAIPMIGRQLNMSYSDIREVVCRTLLVQPNPDNWSDTPIRNEVSSLLDRCEWFEVYDIAEALYQALDQRSSEQFSDRLNRLFREKGIGWEMRKGKVMYRGSETFNELTTRAVTELAKSNRSRAAGEIREAIRDISRRPNPDVTGAVHHAMAAVEATARDVIGQPNRTLGQMVGSLDLPRPLDRAVESLWGFASDRARHIREGQVLDTTDAELLVGVAGALCTFLTRRNNRDT